MEKKNISPSSIHSTDELEKVEMSLTKILVDENKGSLAVLTIEDKKVVHLLPQNEGTILTYVKSGCFQKPHIPTIYHIYINTMESMGYNLEKCVIESCIGDIYYARMHWKHRKTKIDTYTKCSFGDAIIIANMCKAKMYVIKKTIDELEPLSPRLQNILEQGDGDE